MDLLVYTQQQLAGFISQYTPQRIVIAYSGGLDSSALLHCLSRLNLTIPVLAVHVNHGLSSNSQSWAEHCQQQCDELAIPLSVHNVSLIPEQGNLEEQAREARYKVFKTFMEQGDALLMAHHQDDQVETFFMRLMRGSGLTGLSSIPQTRSFAGGDIFRPWLQVGRKTLEAFVSEQKIPHIHDESNDETHFDRNWWRHDLLPRIKKRYPQSAASVESTIGILQQERAVLNALLQPVYNTVVELDGRLQCDALVTYSEIIQVQLIREWLEQMEVYPSLSQGQILQVLQDVVKAQVDAEPVFRWQENEIRRFNGFLYPLAHQKREAIEECEFEGEDLALPNGQLTCLKGVGLKPDQYRVVGYQGGLKAKPSGRPTKTLKKWFQEWNIPPWQRATWPVLMREDKVAAVPGLFVCEAFSTDEGWMLDYRVNKK